MERGDPVVRPGIAAWLAGATLAAALVIGVVLIRSLREAATAVRQGGQVTTTVHGYAGALAAWSGATRPERDSIRAALTVQLRELRAEVRDATDEELVDSAIAAVRASGATPDPALQHAMVAFLARQHDALFAAADAAGRAERYAAAMLALAAIGVGVLIVPMAWLWVRLKRGGAASATG